MASILDSIFGSVPQVAPFIPTDPMAELTTMLGGEISSWPQIENLSNLYQSYMLSALNEAVPGFSNILSTGAADTESLLTQAAPLIQGQIPQDVADQVMRSTAYQSLMSGTAGSGMAHGLTARDLGLTSLDLMNQGANLLNEGGNAAQRWSAIAGGTVMPPSANLYSPEWFSNFMANQHAAQQATNQLANNLAASPNPFLQSLNQWVEQVGGTALGAYTGGSIGQNFGQTGGSGGRGGNYMTSWNPAQYGFGGGGAPSGAGGAPSGAGGSPSYATYNTGFDPLQFGNPFATPDYSLNLAPSYPYPIYGSGGPFNPTGFGGG